MTDQILNFVHRDMNSCKLNFWELEIFVELVGINIVLASAQTKIKKRLFMESNLPIYLYFTEVSFVFKRKRQEIIIKFKIFEESMRTVQQKVNAEIGEA